MSDIDPHVIVLFGARGDLAKRMLLPALADLDLPDFRIIGSGRHEPDGEWTDEVREEIDDDDFLGRLSFVTSDADDGEDLAKAVRNAREELGDDARVLLYLSVPPAAMEGMVGMLGDTGLHERARLIMEKPFGSDLESARALNAAIHEHFEEEQVFRIDHFLGKAPVRELLALSRDGVTAIDVDVPEDLGLEGRGAFYEDTGALRDMVVTHLCQVLGVAPMDHPDAIEPGPLRAAKLAAFEAFPELDPQDVVFGQFEGYRDDEDVADDSTVETYVDARLQLPGGIGARLRTGKALGEDYERVTLRRGVKETVVDISGGEPYRTLLEEALRGDRTWFTHADEVERLWAVVAPVLEHPPAAEPYAQGSDGPDA